MAEYIVLTRMLVSFGQQACTAQGLKLEDGCPGGEGCRLAWRSGKGAMLISFNRILRFFRDRIRPSHNIPRPLRLFRVRLSRHLSRRLPLHLLSKYLVPFLVHAITQRMC